MSLPLAKTAIEQGSAAVINAERRARLAGYTGTFPPPPRPRVDTEADFQNLVNGVLAGDCRANLLWQVAVHAGEFFQALKPEYCGELAKTLVDLAEDPLTPRRVRIRAIQAAVRPLISMVARARKLQRLPSGDKTLLTRLEENIKAFIVALGSNPPEKEGQDPPLIRLARQLLGLGLATVPQGREDQVRAISTAMDLIGHMMDAIIAVRGDISQEMEKRREGPSKKELAQASKELARLEAEIQEKLDSGKLGEASHAMAE